MSLERLAKELDETTRQTAEMADGVAQALAILQSGHGNADSIEDALGRAAQQIIVALQAQDRIDQRCTNMAKAVRNLIASDTSIDHPRFDEIWAHLTLDELAVPEMSGVAAQVSSGDVDLF